MVLSMRLSELRLREYWSEADPTIRGRLSLPVHTGTGASSSAVIYFEHGPRQHHGRHTEGAEEIVLVLDGEAEVSAGDERMRLTAGAIALVPAMVPHDVANVGQGRLRVLGFFSSAAVVSHFDEALVPFGGRELTIGAAEEEPERG
jgi:quercetin dioxygenase-like cupin family protein